MRGEIRPTDSLAKILYCCTTCNNCVERCKFKFSGDITDIIVAAFLGRHNGEYESPREVLNAIPGIELLEMERNRENAFCCGGGSWNFYTDFFGGGEYSPARIRVREAYETGANILAVACPGCMTMLSDAVESEGLGQKLIIKDISEIVRDSLHS